METPARCFASGAGKSLGIGIESNHFDIRMKPLDQRGQSARAAAHVENALTRPQRRLLQERPPGRITAKQLHYRIRRAAATNHAQPREDKFAKIPSWFRLL